MAKLTACISILFLATFCQHLQAVKSQDEDESIPVEVKAAYTSPVPSGPVYLAEHFDNEEVVNKTWILSQAKKEDIDEDIAKYDGIWSVEEPTRPIQKGDKGLVFKKEAKHGAIATPLKKPFTFLDKPLIVQYEVNFQEGQECGGAYLKLLTHDPEHKDLKQFHDKTPYTIMFGPDKCGNDHKLHFIFRHKNPLNGSIEEKHAKKPKERLEDFFKDKVPHLYTLILNPDNTFVVKVDNKVVNEGSLLEDFTPPVNPPMVIDDPEDVQPEDWDDREKIPDPMAVKPEDWDEDAPAQIVDEDDIMPDGWLEDEPPMIPNPDSVKPDDWDVNMDGEWEPPDISNPKCEDAPGCGPYKQKLKKNPRYKGKWVPPYITNPNYKGKWKPRLINNPNYFNDEHPFRMLPIFAVGFELWSMSPDILFDNIIVTDDVEVAKKWADDTFEVRRLKIAEDSTSMWGRMMRSMNHKPGWWALYFFYCTIPVVIYIWYLVRRAREWSIWNQVLKFTEGRPWMWSIFVLVGGIPILLIAYCCCYSSKDKQDDVQEDREPLTPYEELNGTAEASEEGPAVEEIQEPEVEDEQVDNDEKTSETEEILESEKEQQPSVGADGTRRRKPNKELTETRESEE